MTARQLESRIGALRGSLRRLLALHGMSWVIGVALPLFIAAGFVDWLFHLDAVIRAVLLAAVIGTILYLAYSRVLRPLFVRFADLDIAMRIEERWPGLNDRLASTIQFLRLDTGDDRYGSSALREATVKQAIEETSGINFREVIELKPVLKALGLAAGALALAGLVLFAAPLSSRIAMKRLFLPFGGLEWPQQTHLVLDDANTTLKIARGDSFTLSVKVRPGDRIPETAHATYRYADGAETVEPLRILDGGEFRGRIESVNQPFHFSVAAGDDATSVRDVAVRVVPPPGLKALTIRMVSPPYTGLPIQTLAPGLTQLRALEGTKLELEAEASKPLARANLHIGENTAGGELAFDASRTRFKTSVPVKGSFTFWFGLLDTEGFRNRDAVRYDVRGFMDETPRVVIEEPKTDRDIPADATVPVRIVLDDDFGLHSSRLMYRVATGESEPHAEAAIPLWSAPDQSPTPAASSVVKHQELAHDWLLAPLKLPVGTIISYYADARDLDNIKGPNIGKSRELRLRIVSKEDAARQFDDARRELREELARVLTMQNQAITPVQNADRTLSQTDRLPQAQRDDLNNASMIQRQVGSRFTNRDEGLAARIRRMLEDLRNFKIANPEAQKQMEDMLGRVESVRDRNLGPAEQGLTRATKSLDNRAQSDNARESTPPNQGANPDQDQARNGKANPDSAGRTSAQNKAGDQSKSQAKAESKNQSGAQSKGQEGALSKGQEGAQSKGQEGAQSKGQEGAQSKGQEGAQSKGQEGSQSKGQESAQSKDQSGAQSKGQEGAQSKASQDSKASDQGGQSPRDGSQEQHPAGEQKPSTRKDPTREALAEAKTNQKAIADELQKMLDSLGEFETYRGVVKDAQELLKQQEQAMKQTAEVAARPETVGKPVEELTPEQKSELANLASRQSQVRSGLQKLQERMGEMSKRLDESDPLAAAAMREAAEKSQRQGTVGKLGEAAEQLEKNQMGTARSRQDKARDEIRDLVNAIQNRRERELARLVKELKNAENELAKTRAQQAENLKKTQEARKNPNAQERQEQLKRLAKEQAEIKKDLERQLQRLAKLSADAAARAGQSASKRMAQAQGDLDQDQGDEAAKQQEEALADLEEAQDEIEETRREAEEQLANEQLARMGDQLKSLSERQSKIVEETKSFEQRRAQNEGKLTPAQQRGVRGLGQVQSGLKDETGELAEKLDGAPVVALTLRRASDNMDTAAKRLQEIKTDTETEKAQKAAAERFKQLLDSLKADAAGNGGQGGGGGGGGGGGSGAGGGNDDSIPAVAQLKLLKTLQQQINERTDELDEQRRRKGNLTPDQAAELKRLADEEGVLADLVRDMTRPRHGDEEE